MCNFCLSNQISATYGVEGGTAASVIQTSGTSNQDSEANAETGISLSEGSDAAAGTGTVYSMEPGDSFSGTVGSRGDEDWIAVELEAGSSYTINLAGSGSSPLSDTFLEIYDSSGNRIAYDDDGGDGYYSKLDFTADESGTYYISASAYSYWQRGGYTITVSDPSDPTDPTEPTGPSPLDALDWGGSRVGTTNISVYFAQAGEVFDGERSNGWTQSQIAGAMASLNDLSEGTNLTFSVADSSSGAEFKFVTASWADSTYAYMNPPSETNPGVAVFNTYNMDLANLDAGSLEYFVFQHEVGHGLGMSHPHDNGGGSDVMDGVSSSSDMGDYNLNQGIYTMMSYNVGHAELYPNWPSTYGATVGPMAFDLALLQDKYGEKTANTGDDIYVLPDSNGSGTYYSCIWDSSGNDTIAYSGSSDVTISLVAATLDYSTTGGGVLSYADGIRGGYTIANGVVIENASGGSGFDTLQGNSASNHLSGFDGDDILDGGLGDDLLEGGSGSDFFDFSNAGDTDTIIDFEDTVDMIRIASDPSGFGATGFGDLNLSEAGDDVLIEYADNQIILQDMNLASIGSDDFMFV
ncbi:M10 family metallopeptidase C-terminal domain-containing protein [Roseibium sp. RKSG952]|uniref:M10 family metallopeptidase C-terminal domain-containing protein n=1 Tax=Roseibium sp. RKSG952 TaxID=2529384 RepID=UPI0012BC1E23|nr:M10 family metallopeptidase C-terminal domain-containing protein [Roseibium sp. RKSG952]MTH95841.1 hypothetical protein [Roseibium sp. RKSG952]